MTPLFKDLQIELDGINNRLDIVSIKIAKSRAKIDIILSESRKKVKIEHDENKLIDLKNRFEKLKQN